jgi:CheY-like chemotaxis protein
MAMPTILVIDDDRLFRNYLTILLERAGYGVSVLADGAKVEAALQRDRFAAVITDLYMPDADGIETVRRIKRKEPELPVLALTGAHMGADDPCIQALSKFGADAVMIKSVSPADLLGAVKELLQTPAKVQA